MSKSKSKSTNHLKKSTNYIYVNKNLLINASGIWVITLFSILVFQYLVLNPKNSKDFNSWLSLILTVLILNSFIKFGTRIAIKNFSLSGKSFFKYFLKYSMNFVANLIAFGTIFYVPYQSVRWWALLLLIITSYIVSFKIVSFGNRLKLWFKRNPTSVAPVTGAIIGVFGTLAGARISIIFKN